MSLFQFQVFFLYAYLKIDKLISLFAQGLRILEPSGVVLEQVCDPVRTYLRTREDTVRCIVASLIDDSSNELADVRSNCASVCVCVCACICVCALVVNFSPDYCMYLLCILIPYW